MPTIAARWSPCCSRYNIDCCGHDDDSQEQAFLFAVEIKSPNYCDHYETADGFCWQRYCRHEECEYKRNNLPF